MKGESPVQLIYGVNPILEAIKQDGGTIKEIIASSGSKGAAIENILTLASAKNIPVSFKDRSYLDNVAGCSMHQGIVALCNSFTYKKLDEIVDNRTKTGNIILILDGVMDPQNLGAVIRTAHCFGVNGVIIPENRAVSVTSTVIKASAGAAHWMPIVREVNLSRTIEYLKERGFWIYGADADDGTNIGEFDEDGHVVLVLGSEGKGLRPLIRKKCDFFLSIPMLGKVDSLNVSVAAGIILYEISRKQRREG